MYIYLLTLLIYLNMLIVYFQIDYNLYVDLCIIQIVEKTNTLKEIFSAFIVKIGYNVLYSFSVCQIELNKIKNIIEPYKKRAVEYLKKNNIIIDVKILNEIDEIDKNGNINTKIIKDESHSLEILKCLFDVEKYSGVVLHDKKDGTDCVNRIYMEKYPVLKEGKLDYNVSKINFMMVELEHKNEKHRIELKNDMYNYYIVNNSLNQNFFKYYLKNVQKTAIDDNNFDYTVYIIDHNVNIININQYQYIIIEEDGYKIYPETIQTNTYEQDSIDSDDSDKSDDFVKLDESVKLESE